MEENGGHKRNKRLMSSMNSDCESACGALGVDTMFCQTVCRGEAHPVDQEQIQMDDPISDANGKIRGYDPI